MNYLLLAVAALLLAVLSGLMIGTGRSRARAEKLSPPGGARARESCPLCGEPLGTGERIRSALFPGGSDRLTHVFGCPHCLPPGGSRPRSCPVCRAPLPADGYVVARMFERRGPGVGRDGRPRRHLHLLGCQACRAASRRETPGREARA